VGQPADGVALAAARRMLDQVIVAGTAGASMVLHCPHGIKLVVSRKDHRLFPHDLAVESPLFDFKVHEPGQDVQERIPLPDPFPQIPRPMAIGILAVTRTVVVAQVERQELRLLALQLRGHEHLIGVHGEMNQRASLEPEDRLPWVPVLHVLAHRMIDVLSAHRVLQFGRRDGHTVEAKHEINRVLVARAVVKLPRHGQPIRPIQLECLRIQTVRRLEERHVDLLAVALEAMSDHVQTAPAVQGLAQIVQQDRLRIRPMQLFQGLPLLRLGLLDKRHQHRWIESPLPVEVLRISLGIAALCEQMLFNGCLERFLFVVCWHRNYLRAVLPRLRFCRCHSKISRKVSYRSSPLLRA